MATAAASRSGVEAAAMTRAPRAVAMSMAARPTGRIFRRAPRLEEESTEDEVSPAKRAHKRALEADSTEDEVKPAKCAPRRAMEDDSTEDEAPRVVVVSDDDDA